MFAPDLYLLTLPRSLIELKIKKRANGNVIQEQKYWEYYNAYLNVQIAQLEFFVWSTRDANVGYVRHGEENKPTDEVVLRTFAYDKPDYKPELVLLRDPADKLHGDLPIDLAQFEITI